MASQSFNCPNCGAPIEYVQSAIPTIRCPFCNTTVSVPQELRPTWQAKSKSRASGPVIVALALLFVLAVTLIPILIAQQASDAADEVVIQAKTQQAAVERTRVKPTASHPPTPSATPAFAQPALQFGEKGIGPGLLTDARYIGVDGSGTIYVADYQGGRVQTFDSTGKSLTSGR